MKKELVEKYLSTKSLEDLEQSKVATILIAGRAQVAEYDKAQAEVMKDYDACVLRLDSLQADLEKLLAATFMQRVFKIKNYKEKKQELIGLIAAEKSVVDGLVATLGTGYATKGIALKKIDDFVALLKKDGLTEAEVIEEYNRLKEMFEKQAQEPEVVPVAQEVAKLQPETTTSAKSTRTEQNSKDNRRMTPLEKFNARMAKYEAKVASSSAPTQKGE